MAYPTNASGATLRPEIQVLRAFAVLAVVGHHLAPGRVPGGYLGVDVFFVISGYLISAHLLREADRDGRVRLGRFWARRARRLLPASLLVLLVSALCTVVLVPVALWHDVMREVIASALYVQNWMLVGEAQDYFAAAAPGATASPVTHYWSLSLEEQFYLVWPLLVVVAYAVGRRWGSPRYVALGVFALLTGASLAYSVVVTAASPETAYFVTPARVWQFGIGGLLAAAASGTAPLRPRRLLAVLGWVVILTSVATFGEETPVPGWIALAPVVGAAAVIAAGGALVSSPPTVLRRPLAAAVWTGGISYSLYLWHWPLIVLTPYATGVPLDPTGKALLFGAMVVLAGLSARYVEAPPRRMSWLVHARARRTALPAAVGTAVVVLVCQVTIDVADRRAEVAADGLTSAAVDARCFGAHAIANDCADPHRLRGLRSTVLTTRHDPTNVPAWGSSCSHGWDSARLRSCEFGVPREEAETRVALVGDSHARHWTAAIDQLAVEHRWNVVPLTKPACTVTADPFVERWTLKYAASCATWNDRVAKRIRDDDTIDIVVTSAKPALYRIAGESDAERSERMAAGYRARWQQWTDAGKRVVVIGDVPRLRVGDVPSCVIAADTSDDPCTTPTAVAQRPDPMLRMAQELRVSGNHDVVPVDLSRYFCDGELCHAVIGGVVAYGDTNHLLGYFARSLAPYLLWEMRTALDERGRSAPRRR